MCCWQPATAWTSHAIRSSPEGSWNRFGVSTAIHSLILDSNLRFRTCTLWAHRQLGVSVHSCDLWPGRSSLPVRSHAGSWEESIRMAVRKIMEATAAIPNLAEPAKHDAAVTSGTGGALVMGAD